MGIPGLRRELHLRMFEAFLRIPRDGEEPPGESTGFHVVRRDVTADAEVRAGVADHDDRASDMGRAGDGVVGGPVDEGIGTPDLLPGGGIERDEVAVHRRDEDLAPPDLHAPA